MQVMAQLEAGGGKAGSGDAIGKAASTIGCEAAVLQAIVNVESGGDPYDARGRLVILPEKHIFWRQLPGKLRNKARALGLARPGWSRKNYEGLGRKGSDARWTRLRRMAELHETAALASTSWGKAQIMGFNGKLCGWPDVTSFVLALAETEDNQDEAFIGFLRGAGLEQDLRERDFRAIARRYNGSGQVARYAGMMEREYERLAEKNARIRSRMRSGALRLGSEGYKVRALQERLCSLGYHTGVDGDFGPATRRAVVSFQIDCGLKGDGIAGPKTEAALERAAPIMQQGNDGRQNATVKELKERSSTARKADKLKKMAAGVGGATVVAEVSNAVSEMQGASGILRLIPDYAYGIQNLISPLTDFIGAHPWICLAIGAGVVWYLSDGILKRRMHDFRNWRHIG